MYLCPPLKFYAHDANGNPLSGGTLKTYLGTSSNPVQTFADAAGSVKNPQEITLDARGEANVFLDPSLTYMFILCDADGAEIYTQNGVKAPGSGGSAGASSVISTDGTVDVSVSVGSSGETVYDISVSAVVKSLQDALSSETESRKAADAALSDGIAAEKSRAEAAEAAAKTEVVAGANATVKSATGANGQTIYTVSGNAPDVSITSTDASIDISETSTETSKTFNLSVNKNVKNFIGGFVVGTLSLGTQLKGTVSKESGTLAVSSDAIVLPAGTYSVTLKCAASTNTEAFNVYYAAISVMAKVSESVFNLFVFKPDVNSSGTQYFNHSFDITLSAQASISVWGKYETEQSSQGWTLDGAIYIHSVANVNAGGGGGGLTEVAHDATLTGDGTAASPLSVVGGGDSRGIPPTMDSEGYYHIYTLAQMLWVNNSLANLPEKNYKLMNDIVCNSDYSDYLSWETTPPMNEMQATKGGCIQANYFEGNGHTIYGMYSYNGSAYDAAFFGTWDSGTRPTIKNVRLKNCTAIGNTTAEAIITNGTYSNICVESCLFKNLSKNAWCGSTIIEQPSYFGASIVSNVYSINCTLKGGNAYDHASLFIGQVSNDGSSATSEFFNCYENQTKSIVDSFAGSLSYPVKGKNLYKQSGASWNVSGTFDLTDCAEKSTAEMKSQALCDLLNSNAAASSYPATWSYSDGMFPYLYDWTQE